MAAPTRSRRAARTSSEERFAIAAIAAAAALAAALTPAAPTGAVPVDAVLRVALAALVTAAASRSRRWTWLVFSGVAAALSTGIPQLAGVAALVASLASVWMSRRWRPLGAAIGALGTQALLHLPAESPLPGFEFHGASALLAAAAMAPVLISGYTRARRRTKARIRRVGLVLFGLTAAVTVVFAVSVLVARSHVEDGLVAARQALEEARNGEAPAAEAEFARATEEFDQADRMVGSWWTVPARAVPVLGYQADALSAITAEGLNLAEQAEATVRVGDYQDLKYEGGQFNLMLVAALRQPLQQSTAALESALDEVDGLDTAWLLAPLQSRVDRFRSDLVEALPDARLAAQGVDVAPALLGGEGHRRYLVLFTQPAEQRGLGGFIGNYAELTAIDGRVRMTRSGPIRELIQGAPPGTRTVSGPPDFVRRYPRAADYFQDLTLSPDFPTVAQVAAELYPQSGGAPVDGVLLVDPYALAALLTFTGPISIDGLDQPLTRDNAAQILLKDQYTQFGANEDRKDFLEDASRETFDRLTNGSLPGPKPISRTMSEPVNENRFLAWSRHPAEQRLFIEMGLDGSFPQVVDGGDLLSVRAWNAGNSKIDLFLRRITTYQVSVEPRTGELEATVTVALTNDAPPSGLPRYVIGNTSGLPEGTNDINLNVYTPHGLTSAIVDGQPVPTGSHLEAGVRAYLVPVAVPPGQTRTVQLRLAGRVELPGGRYQLTLSPQPVVNPEAMAVAVHPTGGALANPEGLTITDGSADVITELNETVQVGVRLVPG